MTNNEADTGYLKDITPVAQCIDSDIEKIKNYLPEVDGVISESENLIKQTNDFIARVKDGSWKSLTIEDYQLDYKKVEYRQKTEQLLPKLNETAEKLQKYKSGMADGINILISANQNTPDNVNLLASLLPESSIAECEEILNGKSLRIYPNKVEVRNPLKRSDGNYYIKLDGSYDWRTEKSFKTKYTAFRFIEILVENNIVFDSDYSNIFIKRIKNSQHDAEEKINREEETAKTDCNSVWKYAVELLSAMILFVVIALGLHIAAAEAVTLIIWYSLGSPFIVLGLIMLINWGRKKSKLKKLTESNKTVKEEIEKQAEIYIGSPKEHAEKMCELFGLLAATQPQRDKQAEKISTCISDLKQCMEELKKD